MKIKNNWIVEINKIKLAIPKEWKDKLQHEVSIKTKLNMNKTQLFFGNGQDLLKTNKEEILQNHSADSKTRQNIRNIKMGKERSMITTYIQTFIIHLDLNKKFLCDNNIKIFRWKLMHFILPCNELLFQWRIINDKLCKNCKGPRHIRAFLYKM